MNDTVNGNAAPENLFAKFEDAIARAEAWIAHVGAGNVEARALSSLGAEILTALRDLREKLDALLAGGKVDELLDAFTAGAHAALDELDALRGEIKRAKAWLDSAIPLYAKDETPIVAAVRSDVAPATVSAGEPQNGPTPSENKAP